MTAELNAEEQKAQGNEGAGVVPVTPNISPEDDQLSVSESEEKAGFLYYLTNPLRLFKRQNTEHYIHEGRELLDNGSLAQATVAFKRALNIDPNCVPALRGMGKVFFKKGGRANMETAMGYYQEAIKIAPLDADLYAITARIFDAINKRKEATLERKKFAIARALEVDEKNPIANNNMGILFLQQGKVDEAISYFRKALDGDRNFDVAYRNLSATFYTQARTEKDIAKKKDLITKAREMVDKALSISSTVPSLLAKGRIVMMMGEYELALSLANKADELEAANKDVYLLRKLALERLGRFEEARQAFESYQAFIAVERSPKASE
ncbi:MAG: tetratricopeptide repeat protein [Deltaproteobacteria bacterium]|nr:tetratricopeptide repeat protein [Deltaproteobacteria bacterium]